MQTLHELKAENAAKEENNEDKQVNDLQGADKDEFVEVDESGAEVKTESKATEDGAKDKVEIESWMQAEETETSEDEKQGGFKPNHEAASRRKKSKALRGELNDTKDENAELKARIAALESGDAPKAEQQEQLAPRPTREQFDFDDEAYDAAVDDWNDKKLDMRLNAHTENSQAKAQQESQQRAQQETLTKNLDSHYERAQKLIDDGKITEESFRNSDVVVRRSMESIFPNGGNQIADSLISTLNSLGDGSEKVMYQLGVNPSKMQELQNLLVKDPSGLSAMGFLGQLQANITTPKPRRSQTPSPGSKVDGEGGNNGAAGTLKKQYDKMGDNDDIQGRITLKRKARKDGVDTSNW